VDVQDTKCSLDKQLLVDLGRTPKGPTQIHEDIMSTIIMMGQPHMQSASRHIDRRYLWVKKKVRTGEVGLMWTSIQLWTQYSSIDYATQIKNRIQAEVAFYGAIVN
jgi:hypothetical protein